MGLRQTYDAVSTAPDVPSQYHEMSDEDLMTRVAEDRDTEAFSVLHYRYSDSVNEIARSRLRQDSDVRDAVHQTFFNVWRYAKSWNPEKCTNFAAWIHTIERNLIKNMQRKQSRGARNVTDLVHRDSEDEPFMATRPDPEGDVLEKVSRSELVLAFWDALDRLKQEDRDLIVAYHIHGRTMQDCSDELGINSTATKMRLSRARQKLKAEILPKYIPGRESWLKEHDLA